MAAGGVLAGRSPEVNAFSSLGQDCTTGMGIDPGEGLVLLESDFLNISRLAHDHFGLDLSGGKQGMVAARLGRRVRELGLGSFREYYNHVVADASGSALERMVNDLTTNHTSFFREMQHFDLLRAVVLPQIRHRRRIEMWSAACSSGEEPYTIAMVLADALGVRAMTDVRVLATDISTRVLEKARRGVYAEERFRDVPHDLMQRHLLRAANGDGVSYLIKRELRTLVEFRRMNLMESFSGLGSFSVIFCRNVMIYFDRETQEDLVNRLTAHLEPGGYLLIGHSENLNAISHGLEYIRPATFRKRGARG